MTWVKLNETTGSCLDRLDPVDVGITPWRHPLVFHGLCVWLILTSLIWGGVLLIPRSADEWKEDQTHMHVRLASIHSLASSGGEGVDTKPTRGRPDSPPDSGMHCLPVNPTTKRYFGSLEGLTLVTYIFFFHVILDQNNWRKSGGEKRKKNGIQVMQHKMADTMLLWTQKANEYWERHDNKARWQARDSTNQTGQLDQGGAYRCGPVGRWRRFRKHVASWGTPRAPRWSGPRRGRRVDSRCPPSRSPFVCPWWADRSLCGASTKEERTERGIRHMKKQ